jgi:hypothetical protein
MAGEIQIPYGTTGATLYALVRDATGQIATGTTFGAYATASYSG